MPDATFHDSHYVINVLPLSEMSSLYLTFKRMIITKIIEDLCSKSFFSYLNAEGIVKKMYITHVTK